MSPFKPFDYTEVYRRQLGQYAHLGHALWRPSPKDSSGEIDIGDVGIFHEGAFKRLFNARDGELPDGLERMTGYDPRWEDVRDPCLHAGSLHSKTVTVLKIDGGLEATLPPAAAGASVEFESVYDEGAVLHLNKAAVRKVVQPNTVFKDYICKHYHDWEAYVRSQLSMEVLRSGIVLVRGWVKTSSWAMMAFQSESKYVQCMIKGGLSSIQTGATWRFQQLTNVLHMYAIGPKSAVEDANTSPDHNLSHEETSSRQDQCIFLSYYKIKYRLPLRTWPTAKIEAAAGYDELQSPSDPDDDHSSAAPAIDQEYMEVETESEPVPEAYTPVDMVLDYILGNSNAQVAIASDGDIAELFPDDEWPSDLKEYLDHNLPPIKVDENGAGTLSLQDAIRNQQLRRRNMAQQHAALDDWRESSRRMSGSSESAVLPGEKTLPWLPVILADLEAEGVPITSFSISKDGRHIATCSDHYIVKLWDLETGHLMRDLSGHSDSVLSIMFSPDGARLVSGSSDGKAIIWNVDNGHKIAELNEHSAWVGCIAYSPNGETIATGSWDQTVRLWSPSGRPLGVLGNHDAHVKLLQFSPDGKFILFCADTIVHLWNVQTGAMIAKLEGHTDTIWCMKFSNQGDRVVTGADDHASRVWDATSGDELVRLEEHGAAVRSVDFSPDDRYVVSGSHDGTIAVCDSFTGENKFTIRERPARVNSVAYAFDGKYIASGDESSFVKLWDASSGAFVAEFRGHQEWVKTVAWTPDDKSIVSSSDDGSVRVWSVADLLRLY